MKHVSNHVYILHPTLQAIPIQRIQTKDIRFLCPYNNIGNIIFFLISNILIVLNLKFLFSLIFYQLFNTIVVLVLYFSDFDICHFQSIISKVHKTYINMGYPAALLGFSWLVLINRIGLAAVLPINHIVEVRYYKLLIIRRLITNKINDCRS